MSYSPRQWLRIRQAVNVAPRGHVVGLDQLAGVVRVEVLEFGGEGEGAAYSMLPASVVVLVWTEGDVDDALDMVETNRPAGVEVVTVARQARPRDHVVSWVRWSVWRARFVGVRVARRLRFVSQLRLRRWVADADAAAADQAHRGPLAVDRTARAKARKRGK